MAALLQNGNVKLVYSTDGGPFVEFPNITEAAWTEAADEVQHDEPKRDPAAERFAEEALRRMQRAQRKRGHR